MNGFDRMDRISTIEIKFRELCNEIDYWKELSFYYKELYEQEKKKKFDMLNESIEHGKAMMGNVLKLLLDEDIVKEG
jgi:hypothetical protein